jgi:PadR family transcriptional regulator, regulatory protein PadR
MGDPRISLATLKVLTAMLSEPEEPWYGLELAKTAGLKSGTIYPILARLEAARWLRSEWEDVDPAVVGRPQRRLYRLTGEGAAMAHAARQAHVDSLLERIPRRRALRTRPRRHPT